MSDPLHAFPLLALLPVFPAEAPDSVSTPTYWVAVVDRGASVHDRFAVVNLSDLRAKEWNFAYGYVTTARAAMALAYVKAASQPTWTRIDAGTDAPVAVR